MKKEKWMIRITGYGTFEFEGTEQEAEEMRRHKASCERGSGLKWRKENQTEIDILTACQAAYFDLNGSCPWRIRKLLQLARDKQRAKAGEAG